MNCKNLAFAAIAFTVFTLSTSCNSGGGNRTKGEVVNPLNNELLQLKTDKKNDGKRVAVVGYAAFTGDIQVGGSMGPAIKIYSEPGAKGRFLVSFTLPFGEEANNVYVPEEFTAKDLVIYDNEGKAHKFNEKMQFSFTLDLQTDRPRLEKYPLDKRGLPQTDKSVRIYPTYLTDIRIDPVKT